MWLQPTIWFALVSLLLILPLPAAAGGHGHGHHDQWVQGAKSTAAWTSLPWLEVSRSGRGAVMIKIHNAEAGQVAVFHPEGGKSSLKVNDAQVHFFTDGGNYHWAMAVADLCHEETVVINTTFYLPGTGPPPHALLKKNKGELELVPHPLPRERAHYRGGETWSLQVRYGGKPLADAKVELSTEHGTRKEFASSKRGVVKIRFPDDFPASAWENASRRGPQAHYILSVTHLDQQHRFFTTLAGTYRPHVFADRNPWWGVAAIMTGMLLALLLLSRVHGGEAR